MADARQEALYAARQWAADHGHPAPPDGLLDAYHARLHEATAQTVEGIAHGVIDKVMEWLWPSQRQAMLAYLEVRWGGMGGDQLQAVHVPRHGEPT